MDKLIGKIDVLDKGYVMLRDYMGSDLTIVNAARASYAKASDTLTDKDKRLIKFLAREGHLSPFRHVVTQWEFNAPLMVARQHWKYVVGAAHLEATGDSMEAWNESCLPKSQKITGWRSDNTKTIEELLELQESGRKLPYIRSVNEKGELVRNRIKHIWKSNRATVYEVTSSLGFKVVTTGNHRFLTENGYKRLDTLKQGETVMMNGTPAYKDKEWLYNEYVNKERTQKDIAEEIGCSYHTVRSWVRKHGLQQDQTQRVYKYNQKHGVFGKGETKLTNESLKVRGENVSKSNLGKSHTNKREFINPSNINTSRWQARYKANADKCHFCPSTENLQVHHIDEDPFNNEETNLQALCTKHHHMVHGRQVKLVAHPIEIKSIVELETEDVYDIEVEEYGNFISNQFILHNSRRYVTEEPSFYIPSPNEWRSTPDNKKQGSGPLLKESQGLNYTKELEEYIDKGESLYNKAMEEGVAPEQARLFLPAYGMYVKYYWTASVQSVCHFLSQRLEEDSQFEIQVYAKAVLELIKNVYPESINSLVKTKE